MVPCRVFPHQAPCPACSSLPPMTPCSCSSLRCCWRFPFPECHTVCKLFRSAAFTKQHAVISLHGLIAPFFFVLNGEEPACHCRRHKRCGSGRCPGGGHGNPLQYSGLENPMDRGAWWATVHRVAKRWAHLYLSSHLLEDVLDCFQVGSCKVAVRIRVLVSV